MIKGQKRGFTFIEIVITIAILAVLAGISAGGLVYLQKKSHLNSNVNNLVEVIRSARNSTLASENGKQYGVYIDNTSVPNRYVLFEGKSYALRDELKDKNYDLVEGVSFSSVDLGEAREIIFNKLTGSSNQSGSITLKYGGDGATIYMSDSGAVSFVSLSNPPTGERMEDTRHVHFNYSRNIAYDNLSIPCAGETVGLYFDGSSVPQKQIVVCENILAGELEWSGAIDVGGSLQIIEIRTHGLNSADAKFSIHRNRALNTKSLAISISGDNSGNVITYSADGLILGHSSIYVDNIQTQ